MLNTLLIIIITVNCYILTNKTSFDYIVGNGLDQLLLPEDSDIKHGTTML